MAEDAYGLARISGSSNIEKTTRLLRVDIVPRMKSENNTKIVVIIRKGKPCRKYSLISSFAPLDLISKSPDLMLNSFICLHILYKK